MDTQKRIIIWTSAVLIVGVAALGAWQIATGKAPERVRPGILTEAISSADWTKGTKTPKVTLLEYSDFQCPACGAYYPLIEKVFVDYKDRLAFTYRHFPLPQHKNAPAAAYASEAAGNQGKFWEMHAKIFSTQADWVDSDNAAQIFEGYAKDLKLDIPRFKADASSQAVKDAVAHDKETGVSAGVNSTPTFFLNGKKMQNPRSYEEFKALIEYAIANP